MSITLNSRYNDVRCNERFTIASAWLLVQRAERLTLYPHYFIIVENLFPLMFLNICIINNITSIWAHIYFDMQVTRNCIHLLQLCSRPCLTNFHLRTVLHWLEIMINDILKDCELNISYKFWCFIGRDHMVYLASLCVSREIYRRNVLSVGTPRTVITARSSAPDLLVVPRIECTWKLRVKFYLALRGCWTYFGTDWNSAISKSHGDLRFLAAMWALHVLNPQGSTMQQHDWYGGLACLLYHWYCYGKFR